MEQRIEKEVVSVFQLRGGCWKVEIKMRLLCHQGRWWPNGRKNSFDALLSAIDSGYGIEIDIRDCDGMLVISHDPPVKRDVMSVDQLFGVYKKSSHKPCLALNVKSDGLHKVLALKLNEFGISNYFVFDMSLPDTMGYIKMGVPFAVRFSEYETDNQLLEKASFVWLDAFHSEWYTINFIKELLGGKKNVAIVSPELHGRDHLKLWKRLEPISSNKNLYLCTDLVGEALEIFNVNQN